MPKRQCKLAFFGGVRSLLSEPHGRAIVSASGERAVVRSICSSRIRIMKKRYATIVEALADAPAERPFITMWRDADDITEITFGRFREQALGYAALFASEGAEEGDRIVLVLPQDVMVMSAFAGAMLLGAVPAILAYPNFKVDAAKYSDGLRGVSRNLKARLIVVDDAFPEDLLAYLPQETGTRTLRCGTVISPPSGSLSVVRDAPDEIAFIQHSAGTTGLQKGVALSHAKVLRQLKTLGNAIGLTPEDRIYSWLPLYHDMGLVACFMLPLAYHLPLVMQSPITWVMRPESMLSLIGQYRCSVGWVPNFALQFMARRATADLDGVDLSSLRLLVNCSEPVRARSIDEFVSMGADYGLREEAVHASYAMAENVFAVTQSGVGGAGPPRRVWVDGRTLMEDGPLTVLADGNDEGARCLVSSGSCLPGNEVRIVSSRGEAMPDGTPGEILIRSNTLFQGYFNRPDLTERAVQDGWYSSRDRGFVLHGELFVLGRCDDMINVAGKNIAPQDIEETVCADPRIHDGRAVAFGLFNPDVGTEEIVVVVEVYDEVDRAETATIARAARAAVAADLSAALGSVYVRPPRWIVKSTAGKPARAASRDKLLRELSC